MSDQRNNLSDEEALDQTQSAMSSEGQAELIHEAVERVAGAPEPELDPMQAALSKEAQIRMETEALSDD